MKRSFYVIVLLLMLLIESTTSFASFRHDAAGFEVQNVNDTLVVTKDILMTGAPETGNQSISLITKETIDKFANIDFTTERFSQDLEKITTILEKDKKNNLFLEKEEFKYFKTPQNSLQEKIENQLAPKVNALQLKTRYKVTQVNGLPALAINIETPVEATFELTREYTKEEQEALQRANPYIEFIKNGKKIKSEYKIISDTYLVSFGDNLYNITTSYVQYPKLKKAKLKKQNYSNALKKNPIDKNLNDFYQNFSSYNIKPQKFKIASEKFRSSIRFFKPSLNEAILPVQDHIFAQRFNLPTNWLYLQTSQSIQEMPFTAFIALPVTTLEEIAENLLAKDLLTLNQVNDKIKLGILDDSDIIDPDVLVKSLKEGIVSISGIYSSNDKNHKSALSDLLLAPEITKAIFETSMKKVMEYNTVHPELEKFLKLNNLNYNMLINSRNSKVNFSYDLDLNIPYNNNQDSLPINLQSDSSIYFDHLNKFNILTYFRVNNDQEREKTVFDSFTNFQSFQE
ncbi:MAG TPA: hypothetical protein IAB06_00910 [Candidatus Avacidaminococcus intestinavium]|uniref:F-box domain-containing protein n=1 Tax=Candidatus Avacidaminococcus intestinavium TaxID=2840684 RepID=A0A9D1MNW7_9FIRM|nr:hypothetical protein [Candidatus Avacidaminococcus intestinavium]